MSTALQRAAEHPCWTCQSYGYMVASDTVFCLNPRGPAVRPMAASGCTLFALELSMDTGEAVPAPRPIDWYSPDAERIRARRESEH